MENNMQEVATTTEETVTPFVWEAANVYFLLTDRFYNGDTNNDFNFNRSNPAGKLRNFMGGDLKGITQKIKDNYFTDLGINAIWFTPIVEQIHGSVDEGQGNTYAYHGYWARDWSTIDPNFGTREDLKELVDTAHQYGIRILMDIVINHTGPITEQDPVYPDEWVRVGPVCSYNNYENTTDCTLVSNLPDVKTENNNDVEIPHFLIQKWTDENRLEKEEKELEEFFNRTKLPRAPKYYIIKWLTDYVKQFGIDGFRVDTVKHVEEDVWNSLRTEADYSFNLWKEQNPDKVLDGNGFFMVGEVFGYALEHGRIYDFGDKQVDYYNNGFNALINFQFKYDAKGNNYEDIFRKNSNYLQNELKGCTVLNYTTSHDDGDPYDRDRKRPFNAATKLLLSPGMSQIYYGDEIARPLWVDGVEGDANLRSFMNWEASKQDKRIQNLLSHYQKLGKFRALHPAVGAGAHQLLSGSPYVFSRTYTNGDYTDVVIIGIDVPEGEKILYVGDTFDTNTILLDFYSHIPVMVRNKKVQFTTPYSVVLLTKEKPENI